MQTLKWISICIFLIFMTVYTFVTAPPPLQSATNGKTMHVQEALTLLNQENERARALYTKRIVGDGKQQRIAFDEHWAQESLHAGLLPAQFLRETARHLQQAVPLGMYLGSDFAINPANRFVGVQAGAFDEVKRTREPVFFYDRELESNVAMFPDIAVAAACIDCHNKHPSSAKTDWRLNDIMGATTWTYPDDTLSLDAFLTSLAALRTGFQVAYQTVLTEAAGMNPAPVIGAQWPSDGFFLPNAQVFMQELSRLASPYTLESIAKETHANPPLTQTN